MTVDEQEIDKALAAIQRGGIERERAIVQLDDQLGRRLERYFMRNKVSADDAEEMVWEVWLRVCTGQFRKEGRALVWIWVIARNVLISYHRVHRPEVNFDDEEWQEIFTRQPGLQAPAWVTLFIERALHQFTQDHPERSEMLRMLVEEWSAKEIGMFLGCNEGAARDRLYRTRQKVEPYLDECRSAHAV